MLQKLNERVQGVIAWVVISLVAVTFLLFGIDYYLQSHHESAAIAEINGKEITKQAFELQYRRTRQSRDPSLMTAELEKQLKQQVLDEMVMNAVTTQAASKNGFGVSVGQANSAILGISQFQEDGHFSSDRYQQVLSGAFFTPESFQREVSQGMLLNQQRFAFIGTSFVLPNEREQFVKLYLQSRDYDYLQIPVQQFVKKVSVSSQEIEDYYQKHTKEFVSPEQVVVEYVHLSLADIKAKIQVSPEQISRYYDENKTNYYTPAQWKVAHIFFALPRDASEDALRRVQKMAENTHQQLQEHPEQFQATVKSLSDDKISVMHDGVLPWIVAGQTEFDASLVQLTKPGQISAPIKVKQGYELFKLIAYKPSIVRPLAEVQTEIAEQLRVDLAQTAYASTLEKLSDLSYQTPDSLAGVAEALALPIKKSVPFSRQGGDAEFTKNKQVIQAAFSHDVRVLGNNSEPVQLDNDSVVVLRVNQDIPAVEKKLADVRALIKEKLSLMKATQQAEAEGQAILARSSVKDSQLPWKTIANVSRDTDKITSLINDTAFNLSQEGAGAGCRLDNGDYVVVRLKKINEGLLSHVDKEQSASITQQIEANYGMMDYDLYTGELMNTAHIVKH